MRGSNSFCDFFSRRWFVLSKPVLRNTVKQITDDKHNYTGAPWIVANEYDPLLF